MADHSTLLSSKAKPYIYALASFLAAWQIDDFSFEARSAPVIIRYLNPKDPHFGRR